MGRNVPVRLRFATVKTPNLSNARRFYEEALGLRLTREEEEYVQLDVGGAQLCVDLAGPEQDDDPLLIFATNDLARLRQRLQERGFPPISGYNSTRAFMVRDPDGTPVVFEAVDD